MPFHVRQADYLLAALAEDEATPPEAPAAELLDDESEDEPADDLPASAVLELEPSLAALLEALPSPLAEEEAPVSPELFAAGFLEP